MEPTKRANERTILSIIIPTFNSQKTIDSCLATIFSDFPIGSKNEKKTVEVILVDNYSTDMTEEISLKHDCEFIKIASNKAQARKAGFYESRGKYVLLLDDDMCLEDGLLSELMCLVCNDRIDSAIINEEYIPSSIFHVARNIEKKCYVGEFDIESPRLYKREILEKIDWEALDSGWDEMEIFMEAKRNSPNMTIAMYNKKIKLIEDPINLKKKLHHGKYLKLYKKKYGDSPVAKRQFGFMYRTKLLLNSFKMSYWYGPVVFALKFLDFVFFYLGSISRTEVDDRPLSRPASKKW
jgi:glycosyltransferase involved in cell wall biosynthesis